MGPIPSLTPEVGARASVPRVSSPFEVLYPWITVAPLLRV